MHKDDIKDKKPWTKLLKNEEQRERRRRERELDNISIDYIIDNRGSERSRRD